MSNLLQICGMRWRPLLKNPGFAFIAPDAGTRLGANTAIFSVVNGVLLKPLPYSAPEQLIRVFERSQATPIPLAQGTSRTTEIKTRHSPGWRSIRHDGIVEG